MVGYGNYGMASSNNYMGFINKAFNELTISSGYGQ